MPGALANLGWARRWNPWLHYSFIAQNELAVRVIT